MDNTQVEIVKALRGMGAAVLSLAQLGKGVPDLLVAFRDQLVLLECKTPGNGLTKAQAEFLSTWPCRAHVVETPEQAMKIVAESARPWS